MNTAEKLDALRGQMKQKDIRAYIVPTDDFHGSEYVGAYFKAREYLSGFTGSAGTLLVTEDAAFLWTDGRYFLQAEAQLAGSAIELMRSGQPGTPSLEKFLAETLPDGSRVGFDGRTVSGDLARRLGDAAKEAGKTFYFEEKYDLAGAVWKDRPEISKEPVWEPDEGTTGLTREEKMAFVREEMKKENADRLLLTALDEIAWLLDLRGSDVAYTPVFLAYMLIGRDEAALCVHEEILPEAARKKLERLRIRILPYDAIDGLLAGLPEKERIWADPRSVNYHLQQCIPGRTERICKASPIGIRKAVKTRAEIEGMRIAHKKDGLALTRFIYWLKKIAREAAEAGGALTEMSAARKLLGFRKEMDGFLEQSFAPIVAYGPHGAIVHYEATEETDAAILPRGLCLVDSGAHYREGTTDVTRTIVLGETTEEEKRAYTLALKGHLGLARAVFPEGVCGQNLDVLARLPMWRQGLDFNHGTGHGVGFLLSVHEGPQRVHWRIRGEADAIPLREGMIVTNEPGLYQAGKFGIRHENLMLCREKETTEYGRFLCLEPLTLAPFDREAIDARLMTSEELEELNAYHRGVYEALSGSLTGGELEWLKAATEEIR